MGPTKCWLHAGGTWEAKRKPVASGPQGESSVVAYAWISLLHNMIFLNFYLMLFSQFALLYIRYTGKREKVR